MNDGRIPCQCANLQVTQRFTSLCYLLRICVTLLLAVGELDRLPVVDDLKAFQLEMKVGNREFPDMARKRLLCDELY
jgi:hypothetical protein